MLARSVNRLSSMIFLAVVAAWAMLSSALAGCAPFEVTTVGQSREAELIDFNNDGPSKGDHHIGKQGLANKNGEKIGELRWVSTRLDEDTASVAETMRLHDGDIFLVRIVTGIGGSPNVDRSEVQFDDGSSAIIGGTGAYENAHGGGTPTLLKDGDLNYVVNVHCD
jgi:hypothetical protein